MKKNTMEYIDFYDVEKKIDERDRSKYITETLGEAIFHLFTPREASLFFALYDGKTLVEIAQEWKLTERGVGMIKASMVKKLEPYLIEKGVLSSRTSE